MKTLRWSIAGTIVWLLVSYNVAKHYDVSAPHPWIGLGAALPAVGVILALRMRRLGLLLALPVPIAVYAFVKMALVYIVSGSLVALSTVELSIAATTLGLGMFVLEHVESLHKILNDVFGGGVNGTLKPFAVGQDEIYREIRRARIYQRPLTVIAFAHEGVWPSSGDPFERRVHQELMDHAAATHVAAFLSHERTDCEVIVRHGDHLITTMPAVVKDDALKFARKFSERIETSLGFKLRFGCATFPEDGLTFEALLQCAEAATDESRDEVAAPIEAVPMVVERAWSAASTANGDGQADGIRAEENGTPAPAAAASSNHASANGSPAVAAEAAVDGAMPMLAMKPDGSGPDLSLVRSLRSRVRR